MDQVKRIMKVYQRHTQHRLSEVVDGEDHKLMDNMDNLQWLINAGKELEKLEKIAHLGFYSREDPAPVGQKER